MKNFFLSIALLILLSPPLIAKQTQASLNDKLKEGYIIVEFFSPVTGSFSFILEHRKYKDVLICTSQIDENSLKTFCGSP